MQSDIVSFWSSFAPQPGELRVHPDDRAWMERHWPAPLREPFLDWPRYLHSPRFGARDADLHLSHLPAPYWGDLERAQVLICLKNPGFDNTDYFLEAQVDFQAAQLRTIHQQFQEEPFPFVHLDPQFSWSGSFLWWAARFRPITDALQADGLSYRDALQRIAQNVAALQLVPYRSLDSSRLRWRVRGSTMPSVEQARQYLARATHERRQLVLVMRSHADWHTAACNTQHEQYLHGPRLQGVSLHPRFPAGRALLQRLRMQGSRRSTASAG